MIPKYARNPSINGIAEDIAIIKAEKQFDT
jgi:hypothetical protein